MRASGTIYCFHMFKTTAESVEKEERKAEVQSRHGMRRGEQATPHTQHILDSPRESGGVE